MQVFPSVLLVVAVFMPGVRSKDVCNMNDLRFPGLIKPDINMLCSGGEFKVKCKRPYIVRPGINTIACKEGKWNIRENPCTQSKYFCLVDQLNYPGLIKPATKRISSGSKIEIKCKSPYIKISKKDTIICYKGQWSINSNPCRKVEVVCSDLPVPARGSVKYLPPTRRSALKSEIYLPRKKASFDVPEDLKTDRLSKRAAAPIPPNQLETTTPNQLKTTTPNQLETTTEVATTTAQPVGSHGVGSRAMFQCQSKYYQLNGSRIRICQENGKWSGRLTTCIPVCGRPKDVRLAHVLHGNITTIGQWPWQAAISRHFKDYGWFLNCGGSLINELWVITAAHCVVNKETNLLRDPAELKVYLGKYYRSDSKDDEYVKVRKIRKIHVHPDYNPRITDADIALIELISPVELNKRVQPVCLPSMHTAQKLVEGKEGIVTGWGRTELGKASETLLQASLPLISHANCKKAYAGLSPPSIITDYMFCAGFKKGGADSCQGDSGGPFVFQRRSASVRRWVLEGIVSWGKGCGVANQYGVYTTVSKFVSWIQQYV